MQLAPHLDLTRNPIREPDVAGQSWTDFLSPSITVSLVRLQLELLFLSWPHAGGQTGPTYAELLPLENENQYACGGTQCPK